MTGLPTSQHGRDYGIGNGVSSLEERLHALYVDELRQSLMPPVHSSVNGRQTEALIKQARTIGPAAYTEPDATTWIWSDLHLGHEHSRTVFGRPFRTTAAADTAMMPQWTGQNRPFMDTSKPAISGGPRLELRSTSRRPLLARCLPAR